MLRLSCGRSGDHRSWHIKRLNVFIDDIGLNGVQIREGENERPIFFRAANWVADQDKLIHAALSSARNEHDSAGLQTSFPILMKIRKAAGVAMK